MEITKELKEKILNANSEEEVKALLGDEVTEEEAAVLFQEIQKRKESDDLKALDDGNLEGVAGGIEIDAGAPPKHPEAKGEGRIVTPFFPEWLRKWLFGV